MNPTSESDVIPRVVRGRLAPQPLQMDLPGSIKNIASRKFLLYLFIAILAAPYCLWLIASANNSLWTDELITVALVKSASLKHLFSAVLLGLDATPPLYTGYGWLMLHYVVPGTSPELLLRITNAGLICATLWISYLLIRRYFDQMTALTAISAFVFLELWHLKFLTLEVRTYAALVFCTTLAIYVALHSVAHPCWTSLTCTMLAYCLLVSSHTFGIIYVVCIASCTIVAAAAEANIRLALNSAVSAVPAIAIFLLWVPVLYYQAQLGNYIPRPDLRALLLSTYLPAGKLKLIMVFPTFAALILLWRRTQSRKGPTLTSWRRSSNRAQTFVMALPATFGASTLAVWMFSRFVFPVFVGRYFFPNVVLHMIWLSILVNIVYTHVTRSTTRYGLVLVCAVLTGLSVTYWQFDPESRIPCFDSSRSAYLEDPFKDYGPIVGLWSHPWLTRLNRPGETIIFPVDEDALKKFGTNFPPYIYHTRFVRAFAEWSGINAVMTTSQLLTIKPSIMVLDDHNGPWLNYIQLNHMVKLTPLAEMKGCTLWKVEKLE